MDAGTTPDDTAHFPPLAPGERVRCTFPDPGGLLAAGRVYTVESVPDEMSPAPHGVTLAEVPGTFPETLLDRVIGT